MPGAERESADRLSAYLGTRRTETSIVIGSEDLMRNVDREGLTNRKGDAG